MPYGVKLYVCGEYACFTRPEMKAERVSYDVMTPSAARGILEAIHWKPAIRWLVDEIRVLRPIRFTTIRRNEVESKIPLRKVSTARKNRSTKGLYLCVEDARQQRATVALRDVAYEISAHFELTEKAAHNHPDNKDTPEKHYNMFMRRARRGKCFHRPCLGLREFAAHFTLVENGWEPSDTLEKRDQNFGWMLYDMDYTDTKLPQAQFFKAQMRGGIIDIKTAHQSGKLKS